MKLITFILGVILLGSGCIQSKFVRDTKSVIYITAIDSVSNFYEDTKDYTFHKGYDTILIKITNTYSAKSATGWRTRYKILNK